MSKANVEVLRSAYEQAAVRGVDGILEHATEDLVWISDPRFPGGGTHMGKQNVRRWLTEVWIYEEVSIEVEEIVDLGDRALGITRWHATPSGAPTVDWLWCHLASFSGGLVCQAQSFFDRDEALEAAGLQKPART